MDETNQETLETIFESVFESETEIETETETGILVDTEYHMAVKQHFKNLEIIDFSSLFALGLIFGTLFFKIFSDKVG